MPWWPTIGAALNRTVVSVAAPTDTSIICQWIEERTGAPRVRSGRRRAPRPGRRSRRAVRRPHRRTRGQAPRAGGPAAAGNRMRPGRGTRSASSRCRVSPRTSNRLPTLAHTAISRRRQTTPPVRSSTTGRSGPQNLLVQARRANAVKRIVSRVLASLGEFPGNHAANSADAVRAVCPGARSAAAR